MRNHSAVALSEFLGAHQSRNKKSYSLKGVCLTLSGKKNSNSFGKARFQGFALGFLENIFNKNQTHVQND